MTKQTKVPVDYKDMGALPDGVAISATLSYHADWPGRYGVVTGVEIPVEWHNGEPVAWARGYLARVHGALLVLAQGGINVRYTWRVPKARLATIAWQNSEIAPVPDKLWEDAMRWAKARI